MSIKTKLSIIFSCIVTIILLVNNTLHYLTVREQLRIDQERQMEMVAKEIGIAIEHSKYGAQYVEELIAHELRTAAIAVQNALDPDIDNVTNEQLVELRDKLQISEITLMKESEDDIIMQKSSDEKELNLGTKEWGYWYTAFKELLALKEVTTPLGQKLPHYWSGPIDVSSSNPDEVNKWGYYYDGTTNYIISPYLRADQIAKFEKLTGPQAILEKTLNNNDTLLEITGINPKAFGKDPVITQSNGVSYVRQEDRPIIFGNYNYEEKDDIETVQRAIKEKTIQSYEAEINGKHVIKSFYPVMDETPYVIGLVTDYKFIQEILNEQLYSNILISIILLLIVFLASYILANYIVRPIHYILSKVEEISKGNFGARVNNIWKDELGLLSNGINMMSENLDNYTKQIRYQAEHDALTDLPNRRAFTNELKSYIEQAQENEIIAVMFLDLDRFKAINDGFGHTMGDQLLIAVAERMQQTLGQVYRIGGDEFTIILKDTTKKEADHVAQQILTLLTQPFTIGGHEVFVTTSIGISLYPYDGQNAEVLVKNADIAMYRAKEGKDTYQFFSSDMDEQLFKRTILEGELRKAIRQNELQLFYQPKVDLRTGQITGVEALLRWFHPEFGMVPLGDFIPIAEETGLITQIGDWVLKTACAQNKKWQQQGLPPMRVAVNLSAKQFEQANLVETIVEVLEKTKLDPQYLELEITETVAMNKADSVVDKLNNLKALGIQLAIDDFGTGYSSLSYLKKFPIDTLKIDRSFIRDISKDTDNEAIITTIITMAHHLKLNVIAEGVEEEDHLCFLRHHDCDQIQGFLFSKPLSVADFEKAFQGLKEVAVGYQIDKER